MNLPLLVDLGVGLGDDELLFLERGEEDRCSSETLPLLDLAVRRLDEAELVDPRVGRERRDQADVRAFRRLDRADPAVVRRVHVAHLESGALPRSDRAGPRAESRRLWVSSASGLVWSMNCESCEEPKNSFTTAETGLALIRSCGIRFVMSEIDIRSLTARSMRVRPTRNWFSSSSPTERTRRLPRWSMSSVGLLPELDQQQVPDDRDDVLAAERLDVSGAPMPSFLLIMKRPTRARS